MRRRSDLQSVPRACTTSPRSAEGSPARKGSSPGRYDGPIVNAYWAGSEIVALRRVGPDRMLVRESIPAEHVAFLPKAKVTAEHLRELRAARMITGIREDGAHYRVNFVMRRAALRAAEPDGWFAQEGIPVFEADVSPVRRWITDSGVEIDKPVRAYLDLETDSRVPWSRGEEARILCWGIVAQDGTRYGAVLEEDTDAAERKLLRSMFETLKSFDQVIAWNGDRFDFVRIGMRVGRLGLPIELRRWLYLDAMLNFVKWNAAAAESGEEKQYAGLEATARALKIENAAKLVHLGELGGPTTWGMWEAGGQERADLLEYCIDDADKIRLIERETGYIELLETLCCSTFTLPDSHGMDPTKFVEGFLLRIGARQGHRFASRVFEQKNDDSDEDEDSAPRPRKQFDGAFCLEPTQLGIVRDVHVVDFARLYPSIAITWNMSPETLREDVALVETNRPTYLAHLPTVVRPPPPGCCASATNVVFDNEPVGLLSLGVAEMLRLRSEWDKKKKELPPGTPEWQEAARRSAAYKIAANAFYGVIGSPWSRFFVKDVAESIAQTGVWLIHATMKAVEEHGWRTIYADTDSAFVVGPTEEQFKKFARWCNEELYPPLIASKGCTRNHISIEYEKAFDVLVMVGKKRYAAKYLHYKGERATAQSKPEIKGLEYKRGDALKLGRDLQERVLLRMLSGCTDLAEYVELVEEARKYVLEGTLRREEVVRSQKLSKSLREYRRKQKKDGTDARLPAHVEVALQLQREGRSDVGAGVRIEYVAVDTYSDPPVYIPADRWKPGDPFDRFHMWEVGVYGPSLRVLEVVFPHGEWSRWERARPRGGGRGTGGAGNLFGAPMARPVAQEGKKPQKALPVSAKDKKAQGQPFGQARLKLFD